MNFMKTVEKIKEVRNEEIISGNHIASGYSTSAGKRV